MDFTKLSVASANDEGVEMEIVHPITEQSFEPPTKVWVVGIDSDLYQKTSLSMQNKAMKKMVRRNQVRMNLSAEENRANNIELISKMVLKWENVEWEGVTLPCSFENVKMVMMKLPWFLEQVQLFVEDRANFLQD